ncbi:MAG: hypothetical protein ACRDOO_19525 [Actinomadura sp.]
MSSRDQCRYPRTSIPSAIARFAAGHRLRVVLASSDLSYLGNRTVLPVTVHTGPDLFGLLTIPAVPR